MNNEKNIKSGQEVLAEFITQISENKELDFDIVAKVKELHQNNKLSKTNLINALEALRTSNENK